VIVLDTHVLVWWIGGDPKLSRKASNTIRKELPNGNLGISAISAWEVGMLVAKGRLALGMETDEWLNSVLTVPNVTLLPLTAQVALDSTRLPGSFHGDPADRMIVATARAENSPLVTADQRIRAYRHLRTIW
jgi:PIN domain nuclease of toxin-antitoxin system